MGKTQKIWDCGACVLSISLSSVPESWCWYTVDRHGWRNCCYFGFIVSTTPDDPRRVYKLHLGPVVFMVGFR